jgi:hypothetical protein
MEIEKVLPILFCENFLNPSESHGLRLSNKLCGDTVEKFRKNKNYTNIQDLVQKKGYYLNSFESFQFAISLGYLYSNFTLEALDRFGGDQRIREFLLMNGCYYYYEPERNHKKFNKKTIFTKKILLNNKNDITIYPQ